MNSFWHNQEVIKKSDVWSDFRKGVRSGTFQHHLYLQQKTGSCE